MVWSGSENGFRRAERVVETHGFQVSTTYGACEQRRFWGFRRIAPTQEATSTLCGPSGPRKGASWASEVARLGGTGREMSRIGETRA